MNLRDDVILSFRNLQDGQKATSELCPKCNGGRSKERSLSVGRDGGTLWWHCHRASCGWKGKESDGGTTLAGETHNAKKERSVSLIRGRIPAPLRAELLSNYSLDSETLDKARWSYTPSYEVRHADGVLSYYGPRVIMPIIGPEGQVRGEQFRSYSGHKKKAIINGYVDQQMMSWYRWRKYGRVLCIVEDIPSAIRVAEAGVDSLALCGTTLTIERIVEIREQEYKSVWLALDNDAFNQAIAYQNKFGKYLPGLKVKFLEQDFKDMPTDLFQLTIQELT